ncbi:MAG TPA: cell surface protein SprA [Gemmatimonadales bacterium]|nr:cell surface protein SprA [Gemmatimonadales bacterium]
MARFVALSLLLSVPLGLAAQATPAPLPADTIGPHLVAGFPPLRYTIVPPEAHRLAAVLLRHDGAARTARWADSLTVALDSARRRRSADFAARDLFKNNAAVAAVSDTGGFLGIDRRYADLSLSGQARVEVRTQRDKNERCTSYQLLDPSSGCRGIFTPPSIDDELTMRAAGTIGSRLHVDLDYDSQRDFSANNNIRVYYQGLQDEVLQRLDFGTVTFVTPPSRFITPTIPANSFGVSARFQIGDLQIQALAASQKGSVVAQRHYTIGGTTSQPQDRQIRDLDYEAGRFFWVVDPARLPGYPAVDILNVDPSVLTPDQRPAQIRVYRYRPVTQSSTSADLTGITAVATRPDSPQATGRLRWELLVPGTDYYLDPSGTWFALSSNLDQNSYLAVSYVTVAGSKVGTFPSQDNPAGNDSLELIVEPRRGPEVPTFRYEMRQVYRIAGTDLDRSSLQVSITVNQSERPLGGAPTYLAQLGLAVSSDPHLLDVDNRLFPRTRDPGAAAVVRESYIIFPHLTPFADPTRLQPAELDDSLYRTPGYLLLTQGPPTKFTFGLKYNAAVSGDRNTLSLNAFQLRPQSEQITVNGRALTRDVDYTISYDLGQVTFLDPDALFGNAGPVDVFARFEERGIFAVAPTSIFGFTSTYKIADVGDVNLIGIYQKQQSAYNRPPIGFEPTSNFTGGVTTNLGFQGGGLTRLVGHLAPTGATAPSRLDLHGELAFTKPNPNQAGAAYVEDFEGGGGLQVSLRENSWNFSSVPQHPYGLEGIGFAAGFDSADAVMLTWQNLYRNPATGTAVQVRTVDIDSLIRLTSGSPLETVLYVAIHPDTSGGFPIYDSVLGQVRLRWTQPARPGRPRWRTMVTPLSQTGTDLSSTQYLEFWVYQDPFDGPRRADSVGARLVFDLGSVNEDALAIAPESLTVSPNGVDSTFHGRRYTGVGRLDTEREPTGVFNAAADDNGILQDRPDSLVVDGQMLTDVPLCRRQLSAAVPLYGWGDLDVRCTNGNGTLDAEDLNGDNVLNANGASDNVDRYIVDLANSPYFVRNGGPGWALYRIPLRQPDAVLGTPDLHLVQQLRITIAVPPSASPEKLARFGFARMQFVGSPWLRRAATPIQGLSGSVGLPAGEVDVGVVSTDNLELGYVPPPGAVDQSNEIGAISSGVQVNERSLRITAVNLGPGQRAEAVGRFPAGPQNLLKYQTLRLWVRGRGAGWETHQLQAVFKVGSDDRDFYAYRADAVTTSWLPEVVINLAKWRELRAQIESRWLTGQPPSGSATCGGDSTAYVACDGPYLVQVGNPGINPPNLAAVQELSASIYDSSATAFPNAELWVDDIRMSDPIAEIGTAAAFTAHLSASDMADVDLSFIRQDGNYQQIGQDPTYQTSTTASAGSTVRLDRFLPASLGLAAPITFGVSRATTDPDLLQGTDLRGADLAGLRRPVSTSTSWSLTLRRTATSKHWWLHALVDPLSLSAQTSTGDATSLLSTSSTSNYALGASYNLPVTAPGTVLDLTGLVGLLPGFLARTEFGDGLKHPRLKVAPTNIRWSSGLTYDQASYVSYLVPVARTDDSLLTVSQNLAHIWRNAAGLTLEPFQALTLNADLASSRDLRVYPDSTPLGRLVGAERSDFLGFDAGVERDRSLTTSMAFTPSISRWLLPRVRRTSSFVLNRYLTGRDPVRANEDTTGRFLLPQTLNNTQAWEVGAGIDLSRSVNAIFGDSSGIARALRRMRPLDISRRTVLSSTFDMAAFQPSLGYEFAFGNTGDFLSQQGAAALAATDGHTDAVTAAADLPGGFTVSATYGLTAQSQYSRVLGAYQRTDTRQTDWPVGSVRWTQPIRSGPLVLVSSGLNVRQTVGTTFTPEASGTGSTGRILSSSLSPDAALTFRNGMSMTFNYSKVDQVNAASGNQTQVAQRTFNATLNDVFRLPESLSHLRRQVRASFSALRSISTTCLIQGGGPCTSVSDQRRTEISGAFYTDLVALAEAGLSFGYTVNEAREVNQYTTSLFVSASMNIQLSSGGYR